MQIDDMYEEEMIRLASEMSLMEDFELDWDPFNLEEAREKIKSIDELVEESLSTEPFSEPVSSRVNSEPISSAQIRELFALTDNPTTNKSNKTGTPVVSYNIQTYRDSTDSLDRYSQFSGVETPHMSRRPSNVKKDAPSKDTILSIRWKLRWYQKKIVNQIEETHEHHNYTDGRLAVLIELNEYVSNVLAKLDLISYEATEDTTQAVNSPLVERQPQTQLNVSRKLGDIGSAGGGGGISGSRTAFVQVPAVVGGVNGGGSAGAHNPNIGNNTTGFPSVVSAVYALRRGGNRTETLNAVDNLIQLCNFGGELCLPAVKQMMAAGALQSLLSTLARASEWPEVEKQISKVVSILVTYEDDWALLQRSALFILSALYTLQVKTLTQFKTSTKMCEQNDHEGEESEVNPNRSRTASCSSQVGAPSTNTTTTGANNNSSTTNNTNNSINTASTTSNKLPNNNTLRWDIAGSPTRNSSAPLSPSTGQDSNFYHTDHGAKDSASALINDTEVELLLKQQQKDKAQYLRKVQEEAEEEQESLKALLSAAVAKLSLVLASEWGKLSTPLGGHFGTAALGTGLSGLGSVTSAALGSGGFGGGSKGITSNNSRLDPQRRPLSINRTPALGLHTSNTDTLHSTTQRAGRNIQKAPAVENDRILQILLNLIETLADDSLNPTRTQLNSVSGSAGSLGIAAITRFLVKSTKDNCVMCADSFLPTTTTASTTASNTTTNGGTFNKNVSNLTNNANNSLNVGPNWLPPLRVPGIITRQNSNNESSNTKTSGETDPVTEDEEILRQGAIFFSPLMRVDSAAVLCSAALCNLAEVPQCRPGLVSSGALKMIKAWLEIGNDVLAQARVLCFNQLSSPRSRSNNYSANTSNTAPANATSCTNNNNNGGSNNYTDDHERHQHIKESCNAFMEAFGPAYELISNAAAALMHLSGGTDGRFSQSGGSGRSSHTHSGGSTTHMSHGAGGREYIIGWIDAQILAEGLPAVVVKMLHTGVEAFTSLSGADNARPTRSVLPAAVGMHLAQTLYQLCSRVQNRQQLQSIDIPYALCILFENISGQTKNITNPPDDNSECSDEEMSHVSHTNTNKTGTERPSGCSDNKRALNTDSIYAYIFHFGGIYSSRNYKGRHNASTSNHNTPTAAGGGHVPQTALRRDNSGDFLTLYSANVDDKLQHRKNLHRGSSGSRVNTNTHTSAHGGNHTNNTHHYAPNTTNFNTYSNTTPHNTPHARAYTKQAFMKLVPDDLMPIMSSITSSCLDALTYFFADEISKFPYSTNTSVKSSNNTTRNSLGSSANNNADNVTYKLYYSSIVELMCTERVIESIKMASSFLPRGAGRIATIRVISALTESDESLVALYEGGIMDVLMLISSEAEEIQAQRLASIKQEHNRDESTSFFNNIFPSKPAAAERTMSGASSISAISSSNSTHKGRGMNYSNHDYNDDEYDDYDYNNRFSDLSIEETLSVCYALGNLCDANTLYALRMLQSGLFSIMLKLVRSKHMEISRQALRCISSMCAAIASDPAEKAKYYKTKGNNKNGEFMEAMIILSECLKSPSSLLQKGATYTLSLLALIDIGLQDSIVNGPLRTIISMLVDPKNDRDVRAAAEDVLKNLGFLSGVKDFELCGYDFEILKDWYVMKRSQQPQDEALELLRDWVHNLFDDNQGSRSTYQLHRQPSDSIISANDIVSDLAKILNTTINSRIHNSTMNRESFDATTEINNFLNTAGLVVPAVPNTTPTPATRLTPLSIPQLHRNFTESIMRFLPFCIKSPFHDNSTSSVNRTHSVEDSVYDNSPAAGGQYMNRSMHPSSSLSNLNTPIVPSNTATNHISQADLYDWLDRPPLGILHLMELFYSSKLHQMLLMDMTSLGVALSTVPVVDDAYDAEEVACDYDTVYLLPRPHSISAIMLPARAYQSFSRVGRVIEKMVEYSDSNKLWSLIFRDSEYLGDFHTSLLSSLRRCTQICSLSFSSSQRVEDDALLGHLVGQIPPSIRFVSFRSTLSRESIQALCMLLRRHNAAFLNNEGDDANGKAKRSRGTSTLAKDLGKAEIDDSPTKSKGLLGLALTHLTFDAPEINYILELLQQRPGRLSAASRHQSFKDGTTGGGGGSAHGSSATSGKSAAGAVSPTAATAIATNSTNTFSSTNATTNTHSGSNVAVQQPLVRGRSASDGTPTPTTPTTPSNSTSRHPMSPYIPSAQLGGLRYLDLSYNALNDLTCARVLTAALSGPLEGLELSGNIINRGIKFAEVMELFSYEKMCVHKHRLRYLGIAHNNLMSKTVGNILEHLTSNNSLTTLDLSENEIDHTTVSNEMLRKFLKSNTGLRALDLCHNKLNADTFKEIHLGLLENDTLLLLPMAGNQQVEVSPTVNLIQIRLRENRLLYKSQTKVDDYSLQEDKMMAFQTEEELGQRISFNDPDFYAKEQVREDINTMTSGSEHLILDREDVPMVLVEPLHTPTEGELYNNNSNNNSTSVNIVKPRSRLNSHTHMAEEGHTGMLSVGTSTGELATAEAEVAGAKVPGYTLAIAVPVEAYGHTSPGGYNYNSGRARTFSSTTGSNNNLNINSGNNSAGNNGNNGRASLSPGRPAHLTSTIERKLSHTGAESKPVSSPGPSTYNKSRPGSISLGHSTAHLSDPHHGHNHSHHHSHTHSHGSDVKAHGEGAHSTHVSSDSYIANSGTYAVAPSSTHPLLEAADKFSNNTLNVFFSAPLAGFDRSSRPHPLEMLDYTSERELLTQVFREVHRDVSVHFDFATTDALRTALSFGCKALHFSGHGIPHGLCFEDGRAGLQVVKDTQLKDLLGAGGLNLQFVFVSACYSMQVGEAFVKAGVPHVVCVKVDTKIQDAAAIAFTRAFYVALLSGKTVKNSFSIAKEALKNSPYVPDSLLEGAKFILLPDHASSATTEGDLELSEGAANHHHKAIFPSRPVVDWPIPGKHCTMGPNLLDVRTFISSNHLPSPPADFEGREVVMHNLIRSILDRRLVSLVGEDGMGKTSVAAAICKYVSDRELFADSIVYFRAKGHKDYRSFLGGLQHTLLTSGSSSIAARIQSLLSSQSNSMSSLNLVYPEEEVIFSSLESLRMLLVLDNIDELVGDYGDSHTDFRLFLGRLFEQCPYVKVLVVSTDTLSMHNINVGFGIVEYSVLLGPLTLISTLRLFARLAPSLSTATAKREFISALQPHRQLHVSIHSRDINRTALEILSLFGDGHPAKIVQLACESTKETVQELRTTGMSIISNTSQLIHGGASVGGQSMASFSSTPTNNGTVSGTPQISASTSFNVFDSAQL